MVEHSAFFEHESAKVPSKEYVNHNNSTIAQVEAKKKQLRQEAFGEDGSEEKRKEFYDCLKALGELKQIEKRKQENKTVSYQGKQYHKNCFRFASQTVKGTFGDENVQPSYDKQTANQFYSSTYSHHKEIDLTQHTWFPRLPTSPESTNFTPFDTSAIRPRDIKRILGRSIKKSAPGPDGISFSVLFKMESTHHILSTYFSKVLASKAPPPSWGESVVKLVHKKGDTSEPSNFRMIALSGCIGKTYHLILAERLTTYLTINKFVDPTLQKAFLPGINGTIEHNIVMEELIKDAKAINHKEKHSCRE